MSAAPTSPAATEAGTTTRPTPTHPTPAVTRVADAQRLLTLARPVMGRLAASFVFRTAGLVLSVVLLALAVHGVATGASRRAACWPRWRCSRCSRAWPGTSSS
jgi:hypothetical protein